MDELTVQNIPISYLEPIRKNEQLSGDELFLVSIPISGAQGNGYISKSLQYKTLAENVSKNLKIEELSTEIENIQNNLSVRSSVNYVSADNGEPYPYPTVISAISEDTRGRISEVYGYVLSTEVKNIVETVELSNINVRNSQWVRTENVKSEFDGNSFENNQREKYVASYELAKKINDNFSNYVQQKDIVSDLIDTPPTKVASASLATRISSYVEHNYVQVSNIISSIDAEGNPDTNVPSQGLVSSLFYSVSSDAVFASSIISSLDIETEESGVYVASYSLVKSLSNTISSEYLKNVDLTAYITSDDIASSLNDTETKVASVGVVNEVYANLSAKIFDADGDIYIFENVSDADDLIISSYPVTIIANGGISVFYGDGVIIPVSDKTPTSYIGIGKLVKNIKTNKTFYVTDSSFVKISEY